MDLDRWVWAGSGGCSISQHRGVPGEDDKQPILETLSWSLLHAQAYGGFPKSPKAKETPDARVSQIASATENFFPRNTCQHLLSAFYRTELERNKLWLFSLPFCARSGGLYVFINSYRTLVHLKFVSRERVMWLQTWLWVAGRRHMAQTNEIFLFSDRSF